MGVLLNAHCPKCGFTAKGITYGSGMMRRTPLVPAIRKDTGQFVVEEFSDDPNLTFYQDPSMYTGAIEDYGIQNFDISLSPTNNYCPNCKAHTMEFIVVGEID